MMGLKGRLAGLQKAMRGKLDYFELADGTPGKRGPRSLAPVFGLDRRDIERHATVCLPPKLGEIHADLRGLAGMEEGEGHKL